MTFLFKIRMIITNLWRISDILSLCRRASHNWKNVVCRWTPSSMAFWSKSATMRNPIFKAQWKDPVIEEPILRRMNVLVQSRPAMTDIVCKSQAGAAKERMQEITATTTANSQKTPMKATSRTTKANLKMNVRRLEGLCVSPIQTSNSVVPTGKGTRPDSTSEIINDALFVDLQILRYSSESSPTLDDFLILVMQIRTLTLM